jgi:hypothetical protein
VSGEMERCFVHKIDKGNGEPEGTGLAFSVQEIIDRNIVVTAHPLHVVPRETGSRRFFLPLVVLDKTQKIKVDPNHIVRNVVVLRETLFVEDIMVYEGMVDVFAIKEMKVRGDKFEPIAETDFNMYIGVTFFMYKEVSLLVVRSKIAAAIHDAMDRQGQNTNCVTDYVFVSRNDAQYLFHGLGNNTINLTERNSHQFRYNL